MGTYSIWLASPLPTRRVHEIERLKTVYQTQESFDLHKSLLRERIVVKNWVGILIPEVTSAHCVASAQERKKKISRTCVLSIRWLPRNLYIVVRLISYLSENAYISFRCCFKYRSRRQPCEETQHCSKIVGSGGIRAAI